MGNYEGMFFLLVSSFSKSLFLSTAITFRSACSTCRTNYSELREITSTRVFPRAHSFAYIDPFSYYQTIGQEQHNITARHTAPGRSPFRRSPASRTFQQ